MLKLKAKPLPLKKTNADAQGKLNSQQLRADFLSAMKRFMDAAGVGKFGKNRFLYSRPWFLVCGPEGSGKSTLLNNIGISWTAVYPDEQDGHIYGAGQAPLFQWRFSNEAVWIDMAGSLLEDGAAADFQVFIETMAKLRPRRPLDGVVLVTDCGVMLGSEMESVKNKGESLRRRIDQIMKRWGIELPIYCILSNADKITGFNAIYSDPMGKWNERTLGVPLPASSFDKLPNTVFLEELYFILESIKETQVKMLARDQNQANRRLICQFPIKLESLREKIACFIAMLFKKSDAIGKPVFGGFFFTSCQSAGRGLQDADEHIFDISRTIIDHPLNPHKKKAIASADAHTGITGASSSFFALPLFASVIPNNAAPISTTIRRHRQDVFSFYWKLCGAIIVIALFSWFVVGASLRVRAMEKSMQTDVLTPPERSSDGIQQLGRVYKHYLAFQKYAEKSRTISMIVARYDAQAMFASIKDAFLSSVFTTIVQPCSTELCDKQSRMIRLSDNSPENDFSALKRSLQTYIAISDHNQDYAGIIDEKVVAPMLYNITVKSIYGILAVPGDVDTIVKKVLGEYLFLLKKDKNFPYRIKANPDLIGGAQDKLVKLFNADAVYEIACNALLARSRNMGLNEIMGNGADEVMRSSMNLSEVYTPEGWNGYVQIEFKEASRRLERIEDWVVGANKNRVSETFVNPEILYNDIVQRYCEDIKTKWRAFLCSVSMDRFGSLQNGKDRLMQMSGARSDIARLLGRFADWSERFLKADSGKVNAKPFIKFNDDMAFLRESARSKLPEYQKHIEALAAGLAKALEDKSIAGVFNCHEGDPLIGAYQFTFNSMISPLNKEERGFLERLLLEPFMCAIDLLKQPLSKELGGIWQRDVHEPFAGSLDRQYPFYETEKEALFEAVMSFFKPGDGTIWTAYNNYFKPYIAQNPKGEWVSRNVLGMVPLQFSSSFLQCLKNADKISKIFFKSDGKRKTWELTVTPQMPRAKKLKKAKITVGMISIEVLTQQGKSFVWPVEGKEQAVLLEFTDINDNDGTLSMSGPWSFMRLIGNSSLFSGSPFQSHFEVRLKVKSHAKEIILPADVTITDPDHPFCQNVFKDFSIPKVILQSGSQ